MLPATSQRCRPMPNLATRRLTPPEIAELLRVGRDKVFGWIRSGELRATNLAARLGGRPRWSISPEALAEFESRRTAQPTPKAPKRRRQPADVIAFF